MTQLYDRAKSLYGEMLQDSDQYRELWVRAAKVSAIEINPDYLKSGYTPKNNTNDEFLNDPTAAVMNNQYADSLCGMMWSNGTPVKLKPTQYVKQLAKDSKSLEKWYEFATTRLLYHMNHPDANFVNARRSYCYEQGGIGTSGIGSFINEDFKQGIAENALFFNSYGVDNTLIDEGKNGRITTVCNVNWWTVNRIVNEFCKEDGKLKKELLEKLPDRIKKAWDNQQLNESYQIILVVMPREDFDPSLIGKRGHRYIGLWLCPDDASKTIIREESYREPPINMCRNIRIRGNKYGKSYNTVLLSTIKSMDFAVGVALDCIEKMVDPAVGIFNGSIFGDQALDSSAGGMTTFNPTQGQGQPTFSLYDMGDPTPLLQFLLPYMNEKIATASRVDLLLDMNSAKEMTAQESMQRYALRSQSLSSSLEQQEVELMTPTVKRCATILWDINEFGFKPDTKIESEIAAIKNMPEIAIPAEVIAVMESGKAWFDVEYDNELSRIIKGQKLQSYIQFINGLTMMMNINPQVAMGVDIYDVLMKMADALGIEKSLMIDAKTFKQLVEEQADAMKAQAMLAAGKEESEINKNNSQANKSNMEATNAR